MKDIDYAQCNVKVRIEEKKLLTDGQLRELIYAGDGRELRHLLVKTPYDMYLSEDQDPIGSTLMGLETDGGRVLSWAREIAPEPQIVDIFGLRKEYHNLKVLCKEEILGVSADNMLLSGGMFSIDALRHAVKTGTSTLLPEEMLVAIRDVMDRSQEQKDVQQVDVVFDRYYLRQIAAIAAEMEEEAVLSFVQYNADLFNICVLLRANKQGYGRTFLQSVLSSAGKVAKSMWIEMRDKDLRALTNSLLHSPYSDEVRQAIESESGLVSIETFEIVRDNALTEYLKKAKLQAFGPLPLLAFLYAKETERKNMRIILKSRRAGFGRDVAERRLRYSYVI